VRQTYFVPVRESQAGTLALRTGRLPSGERVGLAFTSEASLLLTMGPFQQWVRLAAEPLRGMLAPLGVQYVRIDPRPACEPRPASPGGCRVLSDQDRVHPLKALAPAKRQLRTVLSRRRNRCLIRTPL
jgi:hypothetical protein